MNYLIIDTETENLNAGLGRPWQLGFILEEGSRIKERCDLRIDIPNLNVGADAARITGFNLDYHNSVKRPMNEVIDIFDPYFMDENNIIIGHNFLNFDIYQISNLYREAGRKLDFKRIMFRIRDTLSLARAQHFQSPPPKDKYDFLAWQYKHLHKYDKSFKGSLSALCKRNDIEIDPSKTHDALYDVFLTYQLFKKLEYSLDLP
jgi:DNA polymerase III epsilon subunit-like protein